MTPRQADILRTVVEYYIQTAVPVGSRHLADQFGVSAATVRADMAALEAFGYIMHPHTSAGRMPTDSGYRYYVESLEQPRRKLDTTSRVRTAIKRRINSAGSPQAAIKVAVDSLSYVTQNVAFASLGAAAYTNGLAWLFTRPEFLDNAAETAHLLDNLETWLDETQPGSGVSAHIGRENAVGKSSGCTVIVAGYESPYSERSYIGVIGPTRQNYSSVMHVVESTAHALEEALV